MSAYIVAGGSLIHVSCPTTMARETSDGASFTMTLGGKRKAFLRPGGRRAWSVDVSAASPGEVSTVEAVARYGGPIGWYPPESTAGNLLSPQASGFDVSQFNATDMGVVGLPDGTAARAVALSGAITLGTSHGGYEAIPVLSGSAITVGGWGLGGIRFTGVWRDENLASVGTLSSGTYTHSGWAFRSQSFTPPTTARFMSVTYLGATQIARPTVSWGTTAHDELGTGCPAAVAHAPSHSPIAVNTFANITDSSYQVTEVG